MVDTDTVPGDRADRLREEEGREPGPGPHQHGQHRHVAPHSVLQGEKV